MKSLIVLLLVGILVIVCQADKFTVIANKVEYLNSINEDRRAYAKKARIPNMYKLTWDDHFEAKIKRGATDCDKKTCRIALRDPNADAEKHAQDQLKYLFGDDKRKELVEDYTKNLHMNGIEDHTPGQKTIGCVGFVTTHKKGTDHNLADYGDLEWKTYCLMEPEGTGKSWDVPRGEPGSACGEGYENDDGLCAPKAESSGSAADSKPGATPASRPDISTVPVESSSHGTCLLGVFLAMIMIYGMF